MLINVILQDLWVKLAEVLLKCLGFMEKLILLVQLWVKLWVVLQVALLQVQAKL